MVQGVALALALAFLGSCTEQGHWRLSSRESVGLAPTPQQEPDAIVQIYAAKLWGMRGLFADHTWVSVKRRNADSYTVYEVIGWRRYSGRGVLRIAQDLPDRRWFGNEPHVLFELRGERAEAAAANIEEAAHSYPWPDEYRAFPGPNSNTFTQWIVERVPEIDLTLPLRAVGKSYT